MTTKQLLTLNKTFDKKNWRINPLHKSVEKKLYNLLSNLNDEEIDLILDLLENFTWISNNQYDKNILDVFRKIDDEIIKGSKKFYFFPVVKPHDSSKLKSGLSLIYPNYWNT